MKISLTVHNDTRIPLDALTDVGTNVMINTLITEIDRMRYTVFIMSPPNSFFQALLHGILCITRKLKMGQDQHTLFSILLTHFHPSFHLTVLLYNIFYQHIEKGQDYMHEWLFSRMNDRFFYMKCYFLYHFSQ